MALLALAAPLAACGGSGEGVLSVGGSAPPGGGGGTPPPTGSEPYQTFDQLTGDQTFAANGASIDVKSPPQYQGGSSSSNASIVYSAADNSYKATFYGIDFGSYKLGFDPVAGTTFTLDNLATGVGGPLLYTRVATFSRDSDGNNRVARAVIGVPTRPGDTPVGTATYQQVGIMGNAARTEDSGVAFYTLGNSKLDMSVDFTANTFNVALTLLGTPINGGADQQLGFYTPRPGSMFMSGAGFSGKWTREGSTSTYVGSFNAQFFGPKAAEYGLNFNINDEDSAPKLSAAGVAVGKKR